MDAFERVEIEHPIHEAILVGITDDKPTQFFQEVENNDGFFQVLVGCSLREGDDELAEDVFEVLQRTVRLCPFAIPDHKAFESNGTSLSLACLYLVIALRCLLRIL